VLADRFGVQAVLFGASCFVAVMGTLFCIAAWRGTGERDQ
jgi:hypothetical protein